MARYLVHHNGKWCQVIQVGPWFFNGNPLSRMSEYIVRLADQQAEVFIFVFLITFLSFYRR